MKPPTILSCGEVLWDLFPEGARFGGAPANFACHAAILGGTVSMLSAVGNDPRGEEAVAILQRFGIDTALVQRIADVATGSVGVSVNAAGKPSYEIHANAAWDHIAWTAALESRIAEVDAIAFGTLGQRGAVSRETIRRAVGMAKTRGVLRVLDVNLRQPFYDAAMIQESVALASVLKFSDEELVEVCKACGVFSQEATGPLLLRLLQSQGLDLIVMTCGAEGAILATPSGIVTQPGIPTVVRDTVGAGDSFTAAFALGLLRGEPYAEILHTACSVAAAVCAHAGAVPEGL